MTPCGFASADSRRSAVFRFLMSVLGPLPGLLLRTLAVTSLDLLKQTLDFVLFLHPREFVIQRIAACHLSLRLAYSIVPHDLVLHTVESGTSRRIRHLKMGV